jgi:hypothetical protein
MTSPSAPSVLPALKKRHVNRAIELAPISPKTGEQLATGSAIKMATPMQPQDPAYVAGGRLLSGGASMDLPKTKLPGAGNVNGAPQFQMVDPKTQGFGVGVIRFIGAFTGAVDPHCVELEAWRGMTIEERIKRGVSEQDIEKVEQHYNCDAQRSRRPR